MKSRTISGQITLEEYLAGIAGETAARRAVPEPLHGAIPEPVRASLIGSSRPGGRLRIERAILDNHELSYEPIRAAIDAYAGVTDLSEHVDYHRRGIHGRTGWISWPLAVSWIAEQVRAGSWLDERERMSEEAAVQAGEERRRAWKI